MSISECIRQLRRQRGMTQTELGGERFSKSYVSGVEREKIVPSNEALRFFAEQLEQSADYFRQPMEQPEIIAHDITSPVSSLSLPDVDDEQDETIELLDMVLEGTQLPHASFSQEVSALPTETLISLPTQKQARYCLMKGLILQELGNLEEAQPLLERALVLSPMKHQPAILDALGTNAALALTYQTALSYHRRALHLLELHEMSEKAPILLLKVELHCGNDYRALGVPVQALEHYEHARQSLSSTSNMEIAGQVYMGLSYCTYASIYQEPGATDFSYEEKERLLQRATSFLLQSRTLYQVSSNRMGESRSRLLHAIILLAISTLRRQVALERAQQGQILGSLQSATLLDEAEEQCRQVLLTWREPLQHTPIPTHDIEVVLYTALSSLVSVYVQRTTVARLEGYSDTALRERARAAYLCQRILDTLAKSDLLSPLIGDALTLQDVDMYRLQALPRLPDSLENGLPQNPMSLAAIFSAAGEVAEELGRSATTTTYASDCYTQANACFKASLFRKRQSISSKEHDTTYLIRSYKQCITLIEERLLTSDAEIAKKTCQFVLDLFKDAMYQLT